MPARYRAFLSYSHRDSDFAESFHRELEGWRADRGLVGRETPRGPAPRNLRPIFRDRDDFAGGRTLSEATEEALRQSDFLIVLCSPAAAQSHYVGEEIRLFKAMGGTERIIPVIIAGEPGGPPGENCFPDALVRQVDADGNLTDAIDEPLAADARETGDGAKRALAKVIAGLLGVPFDEIVRRAEQAERRRQRVVAGIAILFAGLAAAAAGMAWLAEERRVVAERNYDAALNAADALIGDLGEELIRIEGVRLETTKKLLDRGAGVYDDLLARLPEARELKVRKAAALAVFAKAYTAKGDGKAGVQALREAERLLIEDAGGPDPAAGGVPLAMVRTRLGTALFSQGDAAQSIRKLGEAVAGLKAAGADALDDPDHAFEAAHAALFFARIKLQEGETDGVDDAETMIDRIVDRWRAEAPDDIRWVAIQVTQLEFRAAQAALAGENRQAADRYQTAIDLLSDTLPRMPEAAALRAMLAELFGSQASQLDLAGQADAAAAARAERVRLLASLAAADAENRTVAMRTAAEATKAAAESLSAGEGSRADALARLRAGLAQLDAAAKAAPNDLETRLARRLALSQASDALVAAKLYKEALAPAHAHLEIVEAELAAAPEDRERLKTVGYGQALLGEALAGAGDNAAAIDVRLKQAAGETVLASEDPSRLSTLAAIHWEIGYLLWISSRREEAIPHYRLRAQILDALAAAVRDPVERARQFGSDRAFVYLNLGELAALTGDAVGVEANLRQSHAIAVPSLAAAPDDRNRLLDLAWAEARLAQLGDAPAQRWREVERLLEAADAMEPLADVEDELLTTAKIVNR